MPTKEQLYRLWESEREFGLTPQHGFGSEHPDHIPSTDSLPAFTGQKIGTWEINPETRMPRLVLDKEFLGKEESSSDANTIDPPQPL